MKAVNIGDVEWLQAYATRTARCREHPADNDRCQREPPSPKLMPEEGVQRQPPETILDELRIVGIHAR
jgi:hypothetical protein